VAVAVAESIAHRLLQQRAVTRRSAPGRFILLAAAVLQVPALSERGERLAALALRLGRLAAVLAMVELQAPLIRLVPVVRAAFHHEAVPEQVFTTLQELMRLQTAVAAAVAVGPALRQHKPVAVAVRVRLCSL